MDGQAFRRVRAGEEIDVNEGLVAGLVASGKAEIIETPKKGLKK